VVFHRTFPGPEVVAQYYKVLIFNGILRIRELGNVSNFSVIAFDYFGDYYSSLSTLTPGF
jgi:hypothetical protein